MSAPQLKKENNQLSLKQVFDAPIERLFECFTQPDLLSQWHAPGAMTIPSVEVDLRPGGEYRIVMKNDDGEQYTGVGVYREIEAPNKLVYSWSWENGEGPDTLVTVLFNAIGQQTEVELIHQGFDNKEATENHSQGWTSILDRLGKFL